MLTAGALSSFGMYVKEGVGGELVQITIRHDLNQTVPLLCRKRSGVDTNRSFPIVALLDNQSVIS